MMRGLKIVFIVASLMAVYYNVSAAGLSFGPVTLSKDTLQYGDTLFIRTTIINNDTAGFYGEIELLFELNNQENVDGHLFNNPFAGKIEDIPAGGSIPLTITTVITPLYYESGRDILVVWPIVPATNTAVDTIINTIYVLNNTAGIANIENEHIFIYNNQTTLTVTGVKSGAWQLYNCLGQLLNEADVNTAIPFKSQSPGIYFITVLMPDRQKMVFKTLKY